MEEPFLKQLRQPVRKVPKAILSAPVPGFFYSRLSPTTDAINAAVTDKTAAIMIELIQGESGVHPMDKAYVQALRKALRRKKKIILIFDEVQTGMGRCGEWFAHQYYGVEPDIFTPRQSARLRYTDRRGLRQRFCRKRICAGRSRYNFRREPICDRGRTRRI